MKKILVVLFMLAGMVSVTRAQGGGGFQQRTPEERVKMQMERLPQTLNLSEDQKTKISAIFMTQAKSRDSLFSSMGQGGDREAMRSKMMELSAATDKKVLPVLNADQQKVYEAYVKERANRGFGGGGPRPQGGN